MEPRGPSVRFHSRLAFQVCSGTRSGLPTLAVVAIESKFLEPYGTHTAGFNPKYFGRQPGLWVQHGFPACQALAEDIRDGVTHYNWLYAPQLLKHALGLANFEKRPWALYYLWYAVPGPESAKHAAEAEDFARRATADGITVRSLTYQELFEGLKHGATKADEHYMEYLGERYFDERELAGTALRAAGSVRVDRHAVHGLLEE